MLSKKEKFVLILIIKEAGSKNSCLLSYDEILSKLLPTYFISKSELETIISNLVLDNYIESIVSDNKGKPFYCFNILREGESFLRGEEKKKKQLISRIALTVALALLSVAITTILKLIL